MLMFNQAIWIRVLQVMFLLCILGYAGDNCQYPADPCNSMPCVTGQCIATSSTSYQCMCPRG